MTRTCAVLLAVAVVLGTSMPAEAQATYSNGLRSGYAGSAPASTGPTNTSPSTSPHLPPAGRNLGTGPGRNEGVMGLSPQLQKELGITRQQ